MYSLGIASVEIQSISMNKSVASKHHSIKAKTLDLLAEIFSTEDDGRYYIYVSMISSWHHCHCVYYYTMQVLLPCRLCQVMSQCIFVSYVVVMRQPPLILQKWECEFMIERKFSPFFFHFCSFQVAHKLWCQVISSFQSSIKIGTERSLVTGKVEPNVTSLEEMAAFCDKILHKQYDEGINMRVHVIVQNPLLFFFPSISDIDTGLDTTVLTLYWLTVYLIVLFHVML